MTISTEDRAETRSHMQRLANAQALASIRSTIKRRVGVNVDLDRLDTEELGELHAFHERLTGRVGWEEPGVEQFRIATLSPKERQRWEALVAQAAGQPGLFEEAREDERLRKRLADLAARLRPQERLVVKQEGAVALPAALHELLSLPDPLSFLDAGLLVAVATSLENGRSVFPDGHVEGDGAERVLVLHGRSSFTYHVGAGVFDSSAALRRLAACGLVAFEEGGGVRRIAYGDKLRAAWTEAAA